MNRKDFTPSFRCKNLPTLKEYTKKPPPLTTCDFFQGQNLMIFLIKFFVNGMLKPFLGGVFFFGGN
jgi:hypothetical protein